MAINLCLLYVLAGSFAASLVVDYVHSQDFLVNPDNNCGDFPTTCKDSKYRTINGSCNNLYHPTWGTASNRYARVVPAKYSDGLHAPAKSVNGVPLPNARELSFKMFPHNAIEDPDYTLAFMSFGQVVAHDVSLTQGVQQAAGSNEFNETTDCCGRDGNTPLKDTPLCMLVRVPDDDPYYSKYNQTCLKITRTTTAQTLGCSPTDETYQQISAVTSYIDLSLMYGSSDDVTEQVREFKGGRFKIQTKFGHEYPPPASDRSICDVQSDTEECFQFAENTRSVQNLWLISHEIVLLRQHNAIASELANLNPHWDDEKLFQESRRITIACFQRIVYYEYLPILLGKQKLLEAGLINKDGGGYSYDYDPSVPANAISEYSIAFRYIHSAIMDRMNLVEEKGLGKCPFVHIRRKVGEEFLNVTSNRVYPFAENNIYDEFLTGMTTQPQEDIDEFFNRAASGELFSAGTAFGEDLRVDDILRGRDLGMPSHNSLREYCGLAKAETFDDLDSIFEAPVVEDVKKFYTDVEDIEVAIGTSIEIHDEGALAGPTFNCLLLEQFRRAKVGDRYFYSHAGQTASFTPEQLKEIEKTTIARWYCDAGDNIKYVPLNPFRRLSDSNRLVCCANFKTLPRMDLKYWKEEQT